MFDIASNWLRLFCLVQGRLEDYDPRRTDVWAAGVMLVVTLLGAFPFDHTKAHNPGTTDDELDLW